MARTKRREEKGEEKAQKRKRRRKARTDGRSIGSLSLRSLVNGRGVVSSDSDSSEDEARVTDKKKDVAEVCDKLIYRESGPLELGLTGDE